MNINILFSVLKQPRFERIFTSTEKRQIPTLPKDQNDVFPPSLEDLQPKNSKSKPFLLVKSVQQQIVFFLDIRIYIFNTILKLYT